MQSFSLGLPSGTLPNYYSPVTADELRRKRGSLGLTPQGLADHVGVAANTVARWERGERKMPSLLVLALEQVSVHIGSGTAIGQAAKRHQAAPRESRSRQSPKRNGSRRRT